MNLFIFSTLKTAVQSLVKSTMDDKRRRHSRFGEDFFVGCVGQIWLSGHNPDSKPDCKRNLTCSKKNKANLIQVGFFQSQFTWPDGLFLNRIQLAEKTSRPNFFAWDLGKIWSPGPMQDSHKSHNFHIEVILWLHKVVIVWRHRRANKRT